jgi:hypothetical protein
MSRLKKEFIYLLGASPIQALAPIRLLFTIFPSSCSPLTIESCRFYKKIFK